jgi:hypothetical protein
MSGRPITSRFKGHTALHVFVLPIISLRHALMGCQPLLAMPTNTVLKCDIRPLIHSQIAIDRPHYMGIRRVNFGCRLVWNKVNKSNPHGDSSPPPSQSAHNDGNISPVNAARPLTAGQSRPRASHWLDVECPRRSPRPSAQQTRQTPSNSPHGNTKAAADFCSRNREECEMHHLHAD